MPNLDTFIFGWILGETALHTRSGPKKGSEATSKVIKLLRMSLEANALTH